MQKNITITTINDCRDANAVGRQQARVSSIFGYRSNFIGITNDLEAAGNLIDTLDAIGDNNGLILVNVAPRNGNGKKWKNGSPFGYFKFKNCLIVSTIDGLTLSLVKKFKLTKYVHVIDTKHALKLLEKNDKITSEQSEQISKTQFRSLDFLPRIAELILQGKKVPTSQILLDDIPDPPQAIWWVDNFGNCKTTLFLDDLSQGVSNSIQTKFGQIKHYSRLKDVLNDTAALVIGSSGLGNNRFIELVIQGKSAAKQYKISSGESLS